MSRNIIHTVMLANRDNEGHEASTLHHVLERALAGLGLPDTLVTVQPVRALVRTPNGVERFEAKVYSIYDFEKLALHTRNGGYISQHALEQTVKEVCSGSDIRWRVVTGA